VGGKVISSAERRVWLQMNNASYTQRHSMDCTIHYIFPIVIMGITFDSDKIDHSNRIIHATHQHRCSLQLIFFTKQSVKRYYAKRRNSPIF